MLTTMKVACVLVALFGLVCSDPIAFKDCGSNGLTNVVLDVSGCSSFPCIFNRGTTATLKLSGTTNKSFKSFKNLVYGTIAGIKVPFPIPQSNACTSGISCPVASGAQVSESLSLAVSSIYPSVSVLVELHLADESGNTAFCGIFPAKIQ